MPTPDGRAVVGCQRAKKQVYGMKNESMRVFYGFDRLPHFIRPAVTVGSYDGVHRGHRMLIERLVAEARAQGGESIVMTFEPHPRITLGRAGGLRLLTTLEEKIDLLAGLGVDNVIVIPFDRSFSALSGREFVERYLIDRVGAVTLVAGFNHRFGHDALACDDPQVTARMRVVRMDPCTVGDIRVSSTAIRRLIDAGNLSAAEHLLGHPLSESVRRALSEAEVESARVARDGNNPQSGATASVCSNNGPLSIGAAEARNGNDPQLIGAAGSRNGDDPQLIGSAEGRNSDDPQPAVGPDATSRNS